MHYLFNLNGTRVLEALSFTKTLYAFDFDGTLAPIVKTPKDAYASEHTMKLIKELSQYVPVAIISGRSLSDLKTRVKCNKCFLIGNHGLENPMAKKSSFTKAQALSLKWKTKLESEWKELSKDKNVFIEDKTYSLALHYRKSRNKKIIKSILIDRIKALEPSPRVIWGKAVINIVPPGAPHKGAALLETMHGLGLNAALYIGDDDTDEDVFSLTDQNVISIRVGQKQKSSACYYIKRQTEINTLLKSILKNVEK